jgi:ParB-like chromosome segregation protein Spo0J
MTHGNFVILSLNSLRVDNQPMPDMKDNQRADLENSICTYGILEPLQVRKNGAGYIVKAGRNRYAIAHKLGLEHVPCLVYEADDEPERDVAIEFDTEIFRRHLDEETRLKRQGWARTTSPAK